MKKWVALALCLLLGVLAGCQGNTGKTTSAYTPTIEQPFEKITWGMAKDDIVALLAGTDAEISEKSLVLSIPYDVLCPGGKFVGLEFSQASALRIGAQFSNDKCVDLQFAVLADDDEALQEALTAAFGEPAKTEEVGGKYSATWTTGDDTPLTDEKCERLHKYGYLYSEDALERSRYATRLEASYTLDSDGRRQYLLHFIAGSLERCDAEIDGEYKGLLG